MNFVKSTFSGGNGGDCVECAVTGSGGSLWFTPAEWEAFAAAARDGQCAPRTSSAGPDANDRRYVA